MTDASAPVVAVAWPHKFLPPHSGPFGGYQPPCGGGSVAKKDVSRLVVCLPLAVLHQEGALRLSIAREKKLFLSFGAVHAQVMANPPTGVTGALVAHLQLDPSVGAAVKHWLAAKYSNPWNEVNSRAVREAAGQGVYRLVDAHRGAVGSLLMGAAKLDPDCDRVAALEPEAARLAEIWRAFREQSAGLYEETWKRVGAAIKAQTESSDSGNMD